MINMMRYSYVYSEVIERKIVILKCLLKRSISVRHTRNESLNGKT
jgi:hypothetical protein